MKQIVFRFLELSLALIEALFEKAFLHFHIFVLSFPFDINLSQLLFCLPAFLTLTSKNSNPFPQGVIFLCRIFELVFKFGLSCLNYVVGLSPLEISFAAEVYFCDSAFEFDFDLDELIVSLAITFPKFLIFFEKFAFVGLGDDVELVEAAELSVVLFKVVFEMEAFVFENPNFFHEMVEVGTR